MNRKQRQTLAKVFEKPERPDISWTDIEGLFKALGAEVSAGRGSRIRIAYKGLKAVFHRPHPNSETNKSTVKNVRRFLENTGVNDNGI